MEKDSIISCSYVCTQSRAHTRATTQRLEMVEVRDDCGDVLSVCSRGNWCRWWVRVAVGAVQTVRSHFRCGPPPNGSLASHPPVPECAVNVHLTQTGGTEVVLRQSSLQVSPPLSLVRPRSTVALNTASTRVGLCVHDAACSVLDFSHRLYKTSQVLIFTSFPGPGYEKVRRDRRVIAL